jgi:L-ascorbate metabolism protein UlaG (beta-lactamase superfamily)
MLVDPYLAPRARGRSYARASVSPLVDLPLSIEELLEDVDSVFVSHLHSDHFDEVAQQVLPKDMPILCPSGIADPIEAMGFTNVAGIDGQANWRDWQFTLTGGQHGPPELLEEMGEVFGFVLRITDEPVVYWVGDSIWCPQVHTVLADVRPDWTVVHACGAHWQGVQPLVMDAAHVEILLREAPFSRVIATHMDSVDHATVSRKDLMQHLARSPELAARLSVPDDGQTMKLTASSTHRTP